MSKEIMDVREIAEYLGVGRLSVYKLVKEDGLPYKKLGKKFIFSRDKVKEWVERGNWDDIKTDVYGTNEC